MSKIESNDTDGIKSLILSIIKKSDPKTTRELMNLVRKEAEIREEQIFFIIQELQDEKKIQFNESIFPESVVGYVFSFRASWYWIIIAVVIVTAITVFSIPQDLIPILYFRNVLGVILVLFLPGYAFIKTLFPVKVPIETSSESLEGIERVVLSVGMSIALASIVGLILYYTPIGTGFVQYTISLLAFTFGFATVAVVREHQAKSIIIT